jgi:hypothetical protein
VVKIPEKEGKTSYEDEKPLACFFTFFLAVSACSKQIKELLFFNF